MNCKEFGRKRLWPGGETEQNNENTVEFEVFTAVVMKSIIFWDVMPCSLLRCNRRFGGTYRLHLQGRRKKIQQDEQVSRWQAESPHSG
jgi:hypothetical protein